jgi:hypothetical protein
LLTSVAALLGADTSVEARNKKPNIQAAGYVDVVLMEGGGGDGLGAQMGWLEGGNNYRLHVPANPPVTQFWSVIVYQLGNPMVGQRGPKVGDVSSRDPAVVKNADGSVDVYVAPTAPKGFENNWVQTKPGEAWSSVLRFYGFTKKLFDNSWRVPDFEKLK